MDNIQIIGLKNEIYAINEMVVEILNIVKSQKAAANAASSGLSSSPDGTVSGAFRVMGEPKQWSSGKGAFLNCKVVGGNKDEWYSVSVTNNVASKVSANYYPNKGDIINVTGKYEEKTEDGKTYRSVFAFRVEPEKSAPTKHPAKTANSNQFDDNEDVPF